MVIICGLLVLLSVGREFDCWCLLPDVVVGCCFLSMVLVLLRVGVVRCCCSLMDVVVCCCGLLCDVSCVRLLLMCDVCFFVLRVVPVCCYWSQLCCATWCPLFSVN